MRKLASGSAVAIALAATPAVAADMAIKAPPPAPVTAPYSWTGFYIGGHVGWGHENNAWFEDTSGLLGGPPGLQDAAYAGSGILGGGQFGFNYQVQSWVFGIEADASAAKIKGSTGVCFPQFGIGNNTCSTNMNSLETVTGRVGSAIFDRSLFYVKGGIAWAQHSYANPGFGLTATSSDVRSGWTVGAGFEYAFAGPLSMFLEYDYAGFGTKDMTFVGGNPNRFTENVRENVQIVQVGLNYRFGGAGVAKY